MKEEQLINKLFSKPKIILLVGNVNEGKSMVLYNLNKLLQKYAKFDLVSYGLRVDLKEHKIYSNEQLEQQQNKIIFGDEIMSLFDLEDRKKRKEIESTLRMIFHNNNILVLSGTPENMKKFISAKADMIIFKKCNLSDFINGSRVKTICTNYRGPEMGSSILNLEKDKAILWDGKDYFRLDIPYHKEFDTKVDNKPIIILKDKVENVENRVRQNVEKIKCEKR